MLWRMNNIKNKIIETGECCSSARDLGEAGGSLMGVTEGHPPPFTIVCTLTNYYNITTID